MEGIEPSTFRFGDERSTIELHSQIKKPLQINKEKIFINSQGSFDYAQDGTTLFLLTQQKISGRPEINILNELASFLTFSTF